MVDLRDEKHVVTETPLLEYAKPSEKSSLWKVRKFQLLLIFLGVFGGCIGLAIAGIEAPILLFVTFGPLAYAVYVIATKVIAKKPERATEEEEDVEWEAQECEKEEMIALARRIYAKEPFGAWRMKDIFYRYRGDPTVLEEKMLAFMPDGTGIYQWFRREAPPIRLESTFRHKPGDKPNTFLVEMTSPALEGWRDVTFDFEVRGIGGERVELLVWLESRNPMPLESIMHWPFSGEFSREEQ